MVGYLSFGQTKSLGGGAAGGLDSNLKIYFKPLLQSVILISKRIFKGNCIINVQCLLQEGERD